jgi:hypothetical protein
MSKCIYDPENNASYVTMLRHRMNANWTPKEIARADRLMASDWWNAQLNLRIHNFSIQLKESLPSIENLDVAFRNLGNALRKAQ